MRITSLSLALIFCLGCGGAGASGAPSDAPNTAADEVHPPPAPRAGDYPAEMNPLVVALDHDDFSGGAAFLAQHVDACLPSKDCAHAAAVLFYNWSIGYENAGDWAAARKVLQDCVATIHDAICTRRLADLESRHRF
jgi:hypothetical protein